MATKKVKKEAIRKDIIDAAIVYSEALAGKVFLYVYGENFLEVAFPADHFLHLTGVESCSTALRFYRDANKSRLTTKQFYFSAKHPYENAKKKLPCLKRLPELTNDVVCILKDMETKTIVYKISLTNLEFTLGLVENIDDKGKKVNDLFLPMSLRVEDTSVERSSDGDIVDFIFVKDASDSKYSSVLVRDETKQIPDAIRHLLKEGMSI